MQWRDSDDGVGASPLNPVHVQRPTSMREWKHWYAVRRARRVTCGDDLELVAMLGLDANTIADTVTRWNGPQLSEHLFTEWFGTPSRGRQPAKPAPPATEPERRHHYSDEAVDDVLVEQVINRQTDPSQLNPQERVAAAARMYTKSQSMTAVQKLLHVSGSEAAKLVGAYQRHTANKAAVA